MRYQLHRRVLLDAKFTRTVENNICDGFYKLWNFPNCLGALDGKHISFRPRKEDGSLYFNYKGFNSIVLLALVDSEYNFMYVDVGCNGRVSDGGVFANSTLCSAIENATLNFPEENVLPNSHRKAPYVILSDEAFKLTNRMIKPYGQRSSTWEKVFNYRLSRARRVVENAFGILANKFQILQREINLSVDKVQNLTLTCCVLHNFIKKNEGKVYL
uniref:DDE Tnp4 domain-containing protein n=1 Tax=Photinus pyralis TaxID=7054 RepID=A0A1Y1MGM7_PHOPY